MACVRPQNLPLITQNLLIDQSAHPFEVRFHILLQGPEPDPKGALKLNEMMAMIDRGWIHTPSDDTLQQPGLFSRLAKAIVDNPLAKVIIFSERRRSGPCPWTGGPWATEPHVLIAAPGNIKRCFIDGSQAFYHASIKPIYPVDESPDEPDGLLLERLWEQNPKWFAFVPDFFIEWGVLDPS